MIEETVLGGEFGIEAEDGLPVDGDDPLNDGRVVVDVRPVAEEDVLEEDVVDLQLIPAKDPR